MKTSNTLLIGLLVVSLLTLVGSTMALRAEYDKIDFNDPFYSYSSTPIKPFRVLKIEGIYPLVPNTKTADQPLTSETTLGIEAGKTFEIRLQKNSKRSFTYRYMGDTLQVRYEPERTFWPIATDNLFDEKPFAYIIVPSLQTIIANGSTCIVKGLTTEQLAIRAHNARLILRQTTIGDLRSSGDAGSLLQTAASNRIGTATIASHDSTGFVADRDVFGKLALQNDSLSVIKAPASLLKKL